MKETTYAAIDVGSNAVRLLIKRTDGNGAADDVRLVKLLLLRVPLRLGFDVFAKGEISKKKAEDVVRFMKACRQLMKIYDVDRLRACATSAMRDAANGQDIIREIRKETDIRLEIISGQEEARIVFNNHIERGEVDNGNYLYVDVGGGSTELNLLSGGKLMETKSFNIGTVRILTGKVRDAEWEEMADFLDSIHSRYGNIRIIGSGGNINKLYKLAEEKDTGRQSFAVAELSRLYHTLKPLSIEQRIDRYGMRDDRADVIIPAAEIFLTVASTVDADTIVVPTIGVADGIIDGLFLADRKAEARRTEECRKERER